MNIDQLCGKANELDIHITSEMMSRLDTYAKLLMEWNEHINLTAIKDYGEIVEKHFLDCILPLNGVSISGSVCDVGSGAGFPGMVWAIVREDLSVTLLEPTGKRCHFLNESVRLLGLRNVTVVNQRAEDYVKEKRETFDCVTARAVANLRILAELCVPLLKQGGVFVAMKGAKGTQEAKEAKHALNELGCEMIKEAGTSLTAGDQRVNLYYRKVKTTPLKYPRNYSQIKKKPL